MEPIKYHCPECEARIDQYCTWDGRKWEGVSPFHAKRIFLSIINIKATPG